MKEVSSSLADKAHFSLLLVYARTVVWNEAKLCNLNMRFLEFVSQWYTIYILLVNFVSQYIYIIEPSLIKLIKPSTAGASRKGPHFTTRVSIKIFTHKYLFADYNFKAKLQALMGICKTRNTE